nr:MFS transporter [Legionella sp. km772]
MHRNIQLFIVIASSILALIATDIILPSLPHITQFFAVTANQGKMLIFIFMVGQFVTALFWGIIADQIGRRKTLFLGMLVFLVGSLLSLKANSITCLYLCRFLQGAGAVVAPVAGWALIQDLYPKDEGAKILAWVGTLTAIIPLFAPVIGGALDVVYGWHSNFVCIAAYSLILCALFIILPGAKNPSLNEALPLKTRFATYKKIIRNKTFISYIALFGLLNCGEWCFLTVAPFFYASKHIPTNSMGVLLMFSSMGFVFGSLLASRLFRLLGIDKTIHCGIQLALFSSSLLLMGDYFHWNTHQLYNALTIGLYISSSALLWGGTTSRALQCFEECRGAASAIRSLILLCFSSFGTYFGRLLPHNDLLATGFFLFFMALCALIVFNNKELKALRLNPETA